MSNIILYHGTDVISADKIKKDGLRPTYDSEKSNWSENPSRVDSVYLTDTFAVKFGLIASDIIGREKDFAIITVSVDENNLYPDEDFLGQIPKCLYEDMGLDIKVADYDLTKKTHYFKDRLDDFKYLWKHSLKWLGTVSHRGVITNKQIVDVSHETTKNLILTPEVERNAEVNFGYKINHQKYHKLQIKKITKKLNYQKQMRMIEESKYVDKNIRLAMQMNNTFYDTTGNPKVDKKVYIHDKQLITTSILTDALYLCKPKPKHKLHEMNYLTYELDGDDSIPFKDRNFKIEYGLKDN